MPVLLSCACGTPHSCCCGNTSSQWRYYCSTTCSVYLHEPLLLVPGFAAVLLRMHLHLHSTTAGYFPQVDHQWPVPACALLPSTTAAAVQAKGLVLGM